MRLYWLCLLSLLWAQEESRARGQAPRPAPAKPTAPVPRPAPEEVLVMEAISGKVVDKNGTPTGGVRIWFVNKATGQVLGETRTSDGKFALAITRADTVIVRLSREGKDFVEKEYLMEELLQGELEIPFAP